ncbi:unnamed protein product [Auanema sp. JU1783]|nr:unnamed protein product [Auanema sp. JU1783]
MWKWTSQAYNLTAIILLIIAGILLLILCVLSILFCRRRRSSWGGDSSVLAAPWNESSCYNEAFDYADETSPWRIEQRRCAREKEVSSDGTAKIDLNLQRLDPSVGAALAVEQLLRDSYVFDTRLMPKPEADVRIIAAKRDYL